MSERQHCAGSTWHRTGFFGCSDAGKYEEDGEVWCGHHAPSKVAARQAKADEQYRAKRDADNTKWDRRNRIHAIGQPIVDAGSMFGPSPDGFTGGPALRGPTETEAHIAMDVLRWAEQYVEERDDTPADFWHAAWSALGDILMDAEGK